MSDFNAWTAMQHSGQYKPGIVTESEFLRTAQAVWNDVGSNSLGVLETTWELALTRWLAEVETPDEQHTDFWRDLDRGLHEQYPEVMADIRAQLTD